MDDKKFNLSFGIILYAKVRVKHIKDKRICTHRMF